MRPELLSTEADGIKVDEGHRVVCPRGAEPLKRQLKNCSPVLEFFEVERQGGGHTDRLCAARTPCAKICSQWL